VRAAQGDAAALTAITRLIDGADAVVNLAGTSIGEGRLTAKRKAAALHSRLDATRALGRAHGQCAKPPPVWVQASATGYYGNAGEARVGEDSAPGRDFLADVCVQWERAAREAAHGARLAIFRFGLVVAKDAPAWQKMILPIRLGAGGPLGSGEQWIAWIDAADVAQAILLALQDARVAGVFNVVSPEPIRQKDLAKLVARHLHRPARVRVPAFALRALLGEVADLLVLASCRAVPDHLHKLGFTFAHPTLAGDLERVT
jgi:uncharacterized protein (TIGR01777 family)